MLSWKNEGAHPLFLGARAPIFLRARAPIFQKGTSTHYSKSNQMENKWTVAKWTWKEWVHENALLRKWVRAPIIFGGSSTHYFGGSSTHFLGGHEHSSFKGAQALIVWRIAKQRTIEQMQNGHERNKFMKCSLEKMRARTHYFWGLEHPLFWGLEHPSF
jgi:hypothetical protein